MTERRQRDLGVKGRRQRVADLPPIGNGATVLAADRSLPVWARMLGIVGPLGTIAFFLVYVGAQTLPALQVEIASLRLENQRLGQLITLNQSRTEENHRLLIRICAAVTEGVARAKCFDP